MPIENCQVAIYWEDIKYNSSHLIYSFVRFDHNLSDDAIFSLRFIHPSWSPWQPKCDEVQKVNLSFCSHLCCVVWSFVLVTASGQGRANL